MKSGVALLRERRYKDLWNKYCGFLDLDVQGFMDIQKRLLEEQLELLRNCELGNHLMKGAQPRSVEEFREQVPLTTYTDYAPYFEDRLEAALPAKPILWQRTSGMWGQYDCKWAPITERMYQELGPVLFGALMLATCKRKYEINLDVETRILYAMAPPPYATGSWARLADNELPLRFLPPLDEAEEMTFEERLRSGFNLALSDGLDVVFGLPSVLVAMGEKLSQPGQDWNFFRYAKRPRMLFRLVKGLLKSKFARRALLPKDLWKLRGVAIGGADSAVYRQKIHEMWGADPLDGYGCTEAQILATQTWDREAMTFIPQLNFLEFIPENERHKARIFPGYQPETCLLDQVVPGQKYEVVITNLLGGAFVRYPLGDLIEFTATRNNKLDINLPQMVFSSRTEEFIDLAGFTRLTEELISHALENGGITSQDWVARAEGGDSPFLHLYLESEEAHNKGEKINAVVVKDVLHQELKRLDASYADLEALLQLNPIEVTFLSRTKFLQFVSQKRDVVPELRARIQEQNQLGSAIFVPETDAKRAPVMRN
jgi:hypothetical protein